MPGTHLSLIVLFCSVLPLIVGCSGGADSAAATRVEIPADLTSRPTRRAFLGAPPVIPHPPLTGTCTTCHTETGKEVAGIGLAPANPHLKTDGMGESSRCRQCHVFRQTDELFRESDFVALTRDNAHGERAYPSAPPMMPHPLYMREDCDACHTGPAARVDVRCTHPDRVNCTQCHLAQQNVTAFASDFGPVAESGT